MTLPSSAASSPARRRAAATTHEITVFDSTGLAVQDLAVALAVYERWRADPGADSFLGVTEISL